MTSAAPPLLALLAAAAGAHPSCAQVAPAVDDAALARHVAALSGSDAVGAEVARRQICFAGARGRDALRMASSGGSDPDAGTDEARTGDWIARIELLALLDPESAAAIALPRATDPDPTVRAVAAHALAGHEPWPADAMAALLRDADRHVIEALLFGLQARPQPSRRRFVARHSDELLELLAQGDPTLRLSALKLLPLDDRPATGDAVAAALPSLAAAELAALLAEVAELAPRWSAAAYEALIASAGAAAEAAAAVANGAEADPLPRMVEWRLAARHLPSFRDSIDDAKLLALLTVAAGPPGGAHEHATAALASLLPRVAPRLPLLLPSLEGRDEHEAAIELTLRIGGSDALDAVITQLATPRATPGDAKPLLATLARLPCLALARRLDEEVAPRLATELRPELAEVALRMPPCEASNRVLVFALRDLKGDARLRPFEAIARRGDSALLGFLLDALDHEKDARVRGRMIVQIAESFGGSDPDDVLELIDEQWRSARASDRLAALEGVPFVALGDRAAAVAEEAVARFAESEPEALLHVLAQVGGPASEAWFERQSARLRDDPEREEAYCFLISRARRLGGARMAALLDVALEDRRSAVREAALRALLDAGDARVLDALPRLLKGLAPARRAPLLSDLGKVAHHPGFAVMVVGLLAATDEEDERAALLELATPALRQILHPLVLDRLDQVRDPGERHALLTALGQLGGESALARLMVAIDAALARHDALVDEDDAVTSEGRTALLALAHADPTGATPLLAEFLLRGATACAERRFEHAAFGLVAPPQPADPAVVAALAQRPAADALTALEAAWSRRGDRAALADERHLSECAEFAARAGAAAAVCEWFDARVLELWPVGSAADFRALLPPGSRRDLLRRGAIADADAALRSDLRAAHAALARGAVAQRERLAALGRGDALLGRSPRRTLATLAALAEGDGAAAPSAAFAAAIREAVECPALLSELVVHGERRGLELAPELAALAATPRPDDAELSVLRRRLEDAHR
jgi:hypothetical protein